jgi:predicted phage baseplate assembly protein
MSNYGDPVLRNLNDCDCCEGTVTQVPATIFNRPGLDTIAYRVGTHSQFKQSLLTRLSTLSYPLLKQLTTRENDDFAIALLDAWATVADVLSFYQERIANESYLRTATERLSVFKLARLIGYKLHPGVAASTYLAFTLETGLNIPEEITIDIGTKVQSIPGNGEGSQTFETVEKIQTRAEWNAIKPRLTQPQKISGAMTSILFRGINTNLKPGGSLLIVTGSQRVFRRIQHVKIDNTNQRTTVQLEEVSLSEPRLILTPLAVATFNWTLQNPTTSTVQQAIIERSWNQSDLEAYVQIQRWNPVLFRATLDSLIKPVTVPTETGVYAFRTVAALFGFNAQKQITYNPETRLPNPPSEWTEWIADNEQSNQLFLDNAYDGIVPKSFVAIQKHDGAELIIRKVVAVSTRPRTDYGISGKVTVLTLDRDWLNPAELNSFAIIRGTTVYAQSEQLELAEEPIFQSIEGKNIHLNGYYSKLKAEQKAILSGERVNSKGINSEVITIVDVKTVGGYTEIVLKDALSRYHRDTVTINANVALATHGETVQEVLGSGDASQPYQSFTLRQPSLTYVSDETPSGATSTLKVRVNDVLWHEVSALYGHQPEENIFVTQIDNEGKTTIQFGDGKTGTRLPSGIENIRATYRKGIGLEGLVKANQLSLLMTRPLGLKSVTNPLPSTGADQPESLEQARRNAPLTVLTLDRIVSLQDYEDFARAFAGIVKALATWTWNHRKREVLITVAGPGGATIEPDSPLYRNLISAIEKVSDRSIPMRVKSYRPAYFRIAANLKINPNFISDQVLETVRQKLQDQFSFDARNFGQGVALSEVIAVIQAVPGVTAVDVDQFYRVGDSPTRPHPRLSAAVSQRRTDGTVEAAELLTLDPFKTTELRTNP